MNSKLIILTILSSIISLIFIFMSYYGIPRLCKIKLGKCEGFAKGYLKLSKAPSKRKIIVSIYGETFEKLKQTVNSLFDQTFRPDQIIISVPPNTDMKLDPFVKEQNLITIHTLSKDYGKCCNLISPLLREKDGDTIIILVSQNTIYGPDFIETLVEESENHPDCIIYVSGYNAKIFSDSNKKVESNSDIINVDMGILIKPKFINTNILNDESFIDSPNVFLSSHINNNVCLYKINYEDNFFTRTNDDKNEKLAIDFYASKLNSFE